MAESLYQRDVYGQALSELGRSNPDIVVMDADLSGSTRTSVFAKEFPERFFNFGVAEQNMMAAAAGIASCGKIVFASTFAMFATGRVWDQVRNTVAYNNFNVRIVATHAGITVGPDGASHQALEDMALMRVIPNMNVVVPCDGPQTREAILASASISGPFYIRLGRSKFPTIDKKGEFKFGKMQVLSEGKDVAIFACGIMVSEALNAAGLLAAKGVKPSIVNVHTVKPLDAETLLSVASSARLVVVCEEHSTSGGLASAVDEVLSANMPKKILRIGVKNRFGQSGEPAELLKEYKLTACDIEKAVLDSL